MNSAIYFLLITLASVGFLRAGILENQEQKEVSYPVKLTNGQFIFIGTAKLNSHNSFSDFRGMVSGYVTIQGSVDPELLIEIRLEVSPAGVSRLAHDIKVQNKYLVSAFADHLDGGGYMSWPSSHKVSFERLLVLEGAESSSGVNPTALFKVLGRMTVIAPSEVQEERVFLIYVGSTKPKELTGVKDQNFDYRPHFSK
jgi:hypothetical protein